MILRSIGSAGRIALIIFGGMIGALIGAVATGLASVIFIDAVVMRGQPPDTEGPGDGMLVLMLLLVGALIGMLIGIRATSSLTRHAKVDAEDGSKGESG